MTMVDRDAVLGIHLDPASASAGQIRDEPVRGFRQLKGAGRDQAARR